MKLVDIFFAMQASGWKLIIFCVYYKENGILNLNNNIKWEINISVNKHIYIIDLKHNKESTVHFITSLIEVGDYNLK